MQKELSDFVKFVPLNRNVEFTVMAHNSVVFEESPKKSAAGVLYQQSTTVIITRKEAKQLPSLPVNFKAIVRLTDGEDYYVWGTKGIPVDVIVTPHLEHVQFDLSCNSVLPLF